MWQNMHEHKEDIKNNLYEEKERRKRKRDENKQLKSNTKATKTQKASFNRRKIVKNLFSELIPTKNQFAKL